MKIKAVSITFNLKKIKQNKTKKKKGFHWPLGFKVSCVPKN